MKRANNEGTIRQRPNGRWEGRVTVGTNPGTGAPIRRSIYGDTQQEVRKTITEISRQLDEGTYTQPSKMTVGQWLDIWSTEYLNAVKPNTVEQYKYQIRVHIAPAIGAVKLSALAAPAIQHMYRTELENGLSPKSIKNMHGVLHKALAQAVRLGYIRSNPTDACDLPRVEKPAISPLQGEQIGVFLKAIKGSRFEALYLVALFTGMRQGEILGLTWSCVDFDKGIIKVNKQLQRERVSGGNPQLVSTKNGKERCITLAASVVEILRVQRQEQLQARLQAGAMWSNPLDFVFTNEIGSCLSKVTVFNTFKRIVQSVGLGSLRFHDLRHTYATLALQNGDNIKAVSENLGHATVAFTLDVYGHVTDQMKKESATRMEAFIKSVR